MNIESEKNEIILAVSRLVQNIECWYVAHGTAVGASFALALGDKIERPIPLHNQSHAQDFRHYSPSVSLYIWCSWRIDSHLGPLASSDQPHEAVVTALNQIVSNRIVSVSLDANAWDLTVHFSDGRSLKVFCDHMIGSNSFDGNWELATTEHVYRFGPGNLMTSEGGKQTVR